MSTAPTTRRFPILFTGLSKAMYLLGMLPRWCDVEVDEAEVRVRMSWAFRAAIRRASVVGAEPYDGRVWGWGAHGWHGHWLVNGSSTGIVELTIDPPASARVLVFPIRRLTTLRVAVQDRDGLLAALARPVSPG